MANRFPLIVDSSALQIKEIPANDNLDLANSSIVNVVDITASGNVTIGGTLTYEDVKNIDSVGLVTARIGIRVLAGGAVMQGQLLLLMELELVLVRVLVLMAQQLYFMEMDPI